jgi:hypothetical protein
MPFDAATQRAIDWILADFGELNDLPRTDASVIWVTTFRALEVAHETEEGGGPWGITKDTLAGGDLKVRLQSATLKLEFLKKMVPEIRASRNVANSAMLVETLKYENLDAPSQSIFRRALARRHARIDSMYSSPIPSVLYSFDSTRMC